MARIDIYTWQYCPFCIRAKALLQQKGIDFIEHSIDGDQKLSDAMKWVVFALFTAEELGINQKNINSQLQKAKSNPSLMSLRRFLGVDAGLGQKLGLADDFVVKVISATGNYGEIYDRNLGPKSAVPIPRGLKNSYKNGGLLISPPLK